MNTKKDGRRSLRRPENRPQNKVQFFGADIITDLQIQQEAAATQGQEAIRLEFGDSQLIEELGYAAWLQIARKRPVAQEDRDRLIQSGKRGIIFGIWSPEELDCAELDNYVEQFGTCAPAEILQKLYGILPGAVLLPIPKAEKGPKGRDALSWQTVSYEQTQAPKYQERLLAAIARGGNLGVRLGTRYLRAIDIDNPGIGEWFKRSNPFVATTLVSHGSARGYHVWFYCKNCPNGQAVYPLRDADDQEYGELRCGEGDRGALSVILGLHKDRKSFYQIENFVAPKTIDFDEIVWPGPAPSEQEKEQAAEARPLRGTSILDYAERSIDLSRVLLGARWLERGQGAFIVAPSGHGKSTLVIQAASCWSCGRTALAIKPPHALRFLILQSEDSDNDVIEMAQLIHRLDLSPTERELVRANTHVEWLNDVAGEEFFKVLTEFLAKYRPDILVINPLTAFLGGDVQDTGTTTEFLRIRLSALLNQKDCGALVVHHTPKTTFQKNDQFSWFDWMYSMAGGATLTNWARAVLVVFPTDLPGTYRFIAAKRFEKIGWQEREYWFAHSVDGEDRMLWVPANHEQIAAAQPSVRRATPEAILDLIPAVDPISQEKLWFVAKEKLRVGKNVARDLVNILLEDREIFEHKIRREGAKAAIGYAKTPPPEE